MVVLDWDRPLGMKRERTWFINEEQVNIWKALALPEPHRPPARAQSILRPEDNQCDFYCHIAIMLIKQLITNTSGYWILPQTENCPERGWQKLCSLTSPAGTKTNNMILKIPIDACMPWSQMMKRIIKLEVTLGENFIFTTIPFGSTHFIPDKNLVLVWKVWQGWAQAEES